MDSVYLVLGGGSTHEIAVYRERHKAQAHASEWNTTKNPKQGWISDPCVVVEKKVL